MGWLKGMLRGGGDELGWDDLIRRVVDAVSALRRFGPRGEVAFPDAVVVRITVGEGSAAVVQGFVERPELDREVGAALANKHDVDPNALPLREYVVSVASSTTVTALEGTPRVPIRADGVDQFRVNFADLARSRAGDAPNIDPYLVAQAIAAVMRQCTVRSATGSPLVWNEYRMCLAISDFERIRPLQALLERDLRNVLASEAQARKTELVGDVRVSLAPDEPAEGDALPTGIGLVRVAFVPTDKLTAPRSGEITMQLASPAQRAAMPPPTDTVHVADSIAGAACSVYWAGGRAQLPANALIVIGRPHDGAPTHFIALTGAGPTVNKQHLFVVASADKVRIGRFPKANPVHVNGTAVEAGTDIEVALPAEISLSRGDFALTLSR